MMPAGSYFLAPMLPEVVCPSDCPLVLAGSNTEVFIWDTSRFGYVVPGIRYAQLQVLCVLYAQLHLCDRCSSLIVGCVFRG